MKSPQHQLIHPQYRPDIDGLRAIAVLSVVGYHAFPEYVSGGFVGVDVFFVISGFLISTIIFSNLERDKFSYTEFYSRRIKRIFPALLLVLILTIAFGWYVLFFDEFSQLGKHVASGAGFVSNIILWREAGYFDDAAELKPLLHLWSLGVEEQFYILWPLLLGTVWHSKFNFLLTTLLVAIISFSINIYWIDQDPIANFFLPFSRVWELMVGGILAYIILHKSQFLSSNSILPSLLALSGLILIGISIILFTDRTPFPGWWALLPTIGTFLIIASPPDAWVNRYLLGNRLAVWVGLISYPLYLWHWPLLSYIQILVDGTPVRSIRVFAIIVSFLLAWGTYLLIEKRYKQAYSKTAISILSLCMVVFFIVGLLIWEGTLPSRQNSQSIELLTNAVGDWNYPGRLQPIKKDGMTLFVKKGSTRKTLFFGDSHIEQYAPRIVHLLEQNPDYNTAVFATGGGCVPIPNVYESRHRWCTTTRKAAIEYISRNDVDSVVIGAAWNGCFLTQTQQSASRKAENDLYYYQDDNQNIHSFKGAGGVPIAMQELESFLDKIVKYKEVFLLLDNPSGKSYSPKSSFDGSRLTRVRVRQGRYAMYAPEQHQLRDKMKAIANRVGATIIDPSSHLCAEQLCIVRTENGNPIYLDGSHLRPFYVAQRLDYIDVTVKKKSKAH